MERDSTIRNLGNDFILSLLGSICPEVGDEKKFRLYDRGFYDEDQRVKRKDFAIFDYTIKCIGVDSYELYDRFKGRPILINHGSFTRGGRKVDDHEEKRSNRIIGYCGKCLEVYQNLNRDKEGDSKFVFDGITVFSSKSDGGVIVNAASNGEPLKDEELDQIVLQLRQAEPSKAVVNDTYVSPLSGRSGGGLLLSPIAQATPYAAPASPPFQFSPPHFGDISTILRNSSRSGHASAGWNVSLPSVSVGTELPSTSPSTSRSHYRSSPDVISPLRFLSPPKPCLIEVGVLQEDLSGTYEHDSFTAETIEANKEKALYSVLCQVFIDGSRLDAVSSELYLSRLEDIIKITKLIIATSRLNFGITKENSQYLMMDKDGNYKYSAVGRGKVQAIIDNGGRDAVFKSGAEYLKYLWDNKDQFSIEGKPLSEVLEGVVDSEADLVRMADRFATKFEDMIGKHYEREGAKHHITERGRELIFRDKEHYREDVAMKLFACSQKNMDQVVRKLTKHERCRPLLRAAHPARAY